MLAPTLRGLFDLLAPLACPGCDLHLDPGERGFCAACEPLLEPLQDCGLGAAYAYGGPLSDAIRRFKYSGRSELAGPLGALLAEAALSLSGAVDLVVPIPLHPDRLRLRGFDQAALLARPVARALGVPLRVGALRRVRDTRSQAGLRGSERATNVRGCFVGLLGADDKRVLLVDDVRTTGATLAAAREALVQAGATSIRTLTLAAADESE